MNKETEKKEPAQQYDAISAEYASLAEVDPSKRFVQYPEALRMLGDIKGKRILDIGCGNGTFTRMLARRGAKVVAYDPSTKQVEAARSVEERENLGIKYFVADQPTGLTEDKFDEAVSVLVLLYANDKENLLDIFAGARKELKEDGSFVSITFNPNYKRLGEVAYNRRFSRSEGGKMQVDFIDESGQTKISAKFSDFSVSDYENAAKEAGFTKIEWVKLGITPEGQKAKGDEFWNDFEDDPPYIGIKASR